MAVGSTTRFGLTTWSAGSDPFTRQQMTDSHNAIATKAAGFYESGSRPTAADEYVGYIFYNTSSGLISYCADNLGSPSWIDFANDWGVVGDIAAVSTAASAGSVGKAARADHVHVLGAGSINSTGLFGSKVVPTSAIADGAVTSTQLGSGAVTAGKIATGGVSASGQFAAGVVDGTALGSGAVTSTKLGSAAVVAGKIAAGAINASNLFAAGVVDATALGTGAVTDAKVASGISASKLTTGTLPAAQVPSIDASKVTTGTFAAARIPDLSASYALAGAATYLNDLANVSVAAANSGEVLAYNGSSWVPASATAPGAHATTHISGGSDEIDGDQLDIDWNPSSYTPSTSPAQATSVDHLTAHLYGIDVAISGKAATTHSHSATQITSGVLAVAQGGTGAASLTSGYYLKGAGTSAITAASVVPWSDVSSRPTTLAGYGITDAAAASHAHEGDFAAASHVHSALYSPLGHSHTVAALTDVAITTVADNEVLAYDSGSGSWINQTAAEAGLAPSSHSHAATDISSGTFSVSQGGTGATTFTSGYYLKGAGTSAITAQNGVPWSDVGTVGSPTPTTLVGYGITDALSSSAGLANLSNVTISSVADNEVLAYNSGTGTWINQTASEAGLAPSSHVGAGGSAHALATGSTAGFMSLTHYNKLEGIAYGAQANQFIEGGTGLTGSGNGASVTIHHGDTSDQSSVNNSGATFIQDVTLDWAGHVTGLGSNTITTAMIGAAPSTHYHDGAHITSGYIENWKGPMGHRTTVNGTEVITYIFIDNDAPTTEGSNNDIWFEY